MYSTRFFFVALTFAIAAIVQAADSPNFVLVLSDDQGWTSTSAAMHPKLENSKSDFYQTPNLERLANRGMRFSQGYSPAGLCCPTRRSIQFGQTALRQGDDDAFNARYQPGKIAHSIPMLLKETNPHYAAAHFGKWDLRSELAPEHLGYDDGDGNTTNGVGSEGDNGAPDTISKEDKWTKHAVLKDPKRIFSITKRANDFMTRMTAAKRPFFVQVSHYAVHVDVQARAETIAKCQQRERGQRHNDPTFAAMTEDLDTGLGQLLDKIDELGITDNTYVIYLADNGAVAWYPPDKVKNLSNRDSVRSEGRNHPLKAGKWTVFEGGVRVPFVVAGPGIGAGTFSDVPVVGYDILPTIADLVGNKRQVENLDGGSFRSALENDNRGTVNRPTDAMYFHRYSDSYGHSAIRMGDYKLVRFWQRPASTADETYTIDEIQLFDLSQDLGETKNLADEMPEKAKQLEQMLHDYLQDVDSNVRKLAN